MSDAVQCEQKSAQCAQKPAQWEQKPAQCDQKSVQCEQKPAQCGTNSCEWCSMVLVEPVYRCKSGHEICGPCYSDVLYAKDVEEEEEEKERRDREAEEDVNSEDEDSFDCAELVRSRYCRNEDNLDCLRPHTVAGGRWRNNQPATSRTSFENVVCSDEAPIITLRPPESKRSFIDLSAGLWQPHNSLIPERVEEKPSQSGDVDANILEVFKKHSISSIDSNKSGGSGIFKPIVCPLDNCYNYVSVSHLTTHFLVDHRNIQIETVPCHRSVTFFIPSSIIRSPGIDQRILVVEGDTEEESSFFTLNIAKHAFSDTSMLLIWIAEIKMRQTQFMYKIQAKNSSNKKGKVVSYFGPVVTSQQEPLSVFENGDCLVIPMSVFDNFNHFADGFDVVVTFSVGGDAPVVRNLVASCTQTVKWTRTT